MRPVFHPPFRFQRTQVYFIGQSRHPDGRTSVTLGVNGKRHEYFLTASQCNTVEYLCKRVSGLKALNFAKSKATETIPAWAAD